MVQKSHTLGHTRSLIVHPGANMSVFSAYFTVRMRRPGFVSLMAITLYEAFYESEDNFRKDWHNNLGYKTLD